MPSPYQHCVFQRPGSQRPRVRAHVQPVQLAQGPNRLYAAHVGPVRNDSCHQGPQLEGVPRGSEHTAHGSRPPPSAWAPADTCFVHRSTESRIRYMELLPYQPSPPLSSRNPVAHGDPRGVSDKMDDDVQCARRTISIMLAEVGRGHVVRAKVRQPDYTRPPLSPPPPYTNTGWDQMSWPRPTGHVRRRSDDG